MKGGNEMNILNDIDLFNIVGGASSSNLLGIVYKFFRTIRIKLLMKKLYTE